ncbi:conserved protein of unknown function [Acidithiobacillus ferrivorans]|uniref:Uncharacterized protein n=1 Tax=Acidithiobacillus ferrivorans TaxID=160808 RepID=A0A060V0A5_9PROT|nr:hypothetical protein [Acidithiobacillus ferrivorans]CDQ12109.1 conserved hypothetical protein [Acidithiobacillus ferrivorans]SMH64764.1 conserved protein of unknown function [Acidithiobacillus ferrivorans]
MRVITQINPGHKEIYDDLFNTPPRERADRLRFLAMLGSLILKGHIPLYGGPSQPLVELAVVHPPGPDPQAAREKEIVQSRMVKRLAAGLME